MRRKIVSLLAAIAALGIVVPASATSPRDHAVSRAISRKNAEKRGFTSSDQVIARAMVPTREQIAAGTSPIASLDGLGLPQQMIGVGLQPAAGGGYRRLPFCNIDLGTGYTVLCVTLVDQNGNAVSASSGGGSSSSSGAVYPAPSSSPFPVVPAPGATFLMAPAPGATFLFNPNPNASAYPLATPSAPYPLATPASAYPLATPGALYALATPTAPYPLGTPASSYPIASPVAPYPLATPTVPYPLATPAAPYAIATPVAPYPVATPAAPYPVATVTALPLAIPTGGVPLGTPAPGSTLAPVNGGSPVTATNPDPLASAGSTAAPVLGSIKKTSYTFSTTPLAANSLFQGNWIDSTVDNVSTLSVSIAMTGGGNASFLLDTTDDPTQTNFATVALSIASGTYYNPVYSIPNRFWRVRFTTGTTAQTAFSLTGTTSGVPQAVGPTLATRSYAAITDSVHTASLPNIASSGDASSNFGLGVAAYKKTYNGATADADFYCSGVPVAINVSAAGTTQLVALSGTTRIRVCGYQFTAAGTAPTVQFEYGTGTACATGTVAFSGAMAPITGTPISSPPSSLASFVVPAGNALCLVTGGTTPSIQGYLTYVQY